jgi:hypothetical protein
MAKIELPETYFHEKAAIKDNYEKGLIDKQTYLLQSEANRLEGLLLLFAQTKPLASYRRLQRRMKKYLDVIDSKYTHNKDNSEAKEQELNKT